MKEKEHGFAVKASSWLACVIVVCPLLLLWVNNILVRLSIPYWKLCILSVPFMIALKIPHISKVWVAILALCLVVQTAAWLNLITFPIFK